jgi:endoplasmic reticulum-Golgi intermediate compartment protein 3
VLSLDVMDASGEVQTDVASTLFKTRLNEEGTQIDIAKMQVGYNYDPPPEDYCGPCYGGKSPHENGCCNTCQDVRDAYQANGWGISDYNAMEQCVREQYLAISRILVDGSYKENLQGQSHEGCNLAGYIQVNKVSGNFHIAPGRSFAMNGMHVHDTVTFSKLRSLTF